MSEVIIKLHPDRSGRVLIHWFVRDEKGPIETPGGAVPTAGGPLRMGSVRGYLACSPQTNKVGMALAASAPHLLVHSDDVRAVTCDTCLATSEAKRTLLELKEILEPNNPDLEVQKMALAIAR